MSAGDHAVAAVTAQMALVADGAVLGLALAYVAFRSLTKFAATSSALRKIRDAPSVHVSDLRSLISEETDGGDGDGDAGKTISKVLVVVRGSVESKSVVNSSWQGLFSDAIVSKHSGDRGVVIQRSQECIYNEWRGFFGWYSDIHSVLARAWREQGSTSMRSVPFVLADDLQQPQVNYVVVDLDGSNQPLPLTTVYQNLQPIQASPYTFLQALIGHEYPVGLLDVEKILPLGKEVTAVGICSSKNGVLEIKSCRDLPYFLSELTKDQMVIELSSKMKILFWSGVIVGSVSIGILGYSILRNWNKWKQWREQRRADLAGLSGEDNNEVEESEEEEVGGVPSGELCVICLIRQCRSAFLPCGHLVCCQRCAFSVQRELLPKCPVCRQPIHGALRIFGA